MLIITVQDEVAGTGALVNRLIYAVTEKEGKTEVLRDWELLRVLNTLLSRSSPTAIPEAIKGEAAVERLKNVFDADLGAHAPTLHRPTSWPEMLFVPSVQTEAKPT